MEKEKEKKEKTVQIAKQRAFLEIMELITFANGDPFLQGDPADQRFQMMLVRHLMHHVNGGEDEIDLIDLPRPLFGLLQNHRFGPNRNLM